MNQKYIVISVNGRELMFAFPNDVMHSWMFENVKMIKKGMPNNWHRPYLDAQIVSAGFIMGGKCFGFSESLGIESRPLIDAELLARGGM